MLVENSGLQPKKAPSSKGEFVKKKKTTDNANIFQLVVVTKACYGAYASICRSSYDIKIWPIH